MNMIPVIRNKKGQAFESFRLLIAFILAIAILAIIYTMVAKVNKETVIISTQKFEEAVRSASKSPGTSSVVPFVIEDVVLEGAIDKHRLGLITGLSEECLSLQAGPGITVTTRGVDILKKLKMNVYVYCNYQNAEINNVDMSYIVNTTITSSTCPTYCVIFMNRKPPEGTYEGS